MSMSQEERDAQDALTASEKPLKDWLNEIASLDDRMPRYFEDLLDDIIKENILPVSKFSSELKKNYNKKKEIRSRKPNA